MKWTSAISEREPTIEALAEVVVRLKSTWNEPPDVACVFASPDHAGRFPQLAEDLLSEVLRFGYLHPPTLEIA